MGNKTSKISKKLLKVPKINILKILANNPPLPQVAVAGPSARNGTMANVIDDIGDGIQVEVNPAEDEYMDEDIHEQSLLECNTYSTSSDDSDDESDHDQQEDLEDFHRSQPAQEIASHSEDSELKELENDPRVQMLIQHALAGENNVVKPQNQGKKSALNSRQREKIVGKEANNLNNKMTVRNVIKSPSDTTLYRPALEKESSKPDRVSNPTDQISNFIDRIRRQSIANSPVVESNRWDTSHRDDRETQSEADKRIVQAEQFKAAIAKPTGKIDQVNRFIDKIPNNNATIFNQFVMEASEGQYDFSKFLGILTESQDDEYFHLTCHVEPALKERIENGLFVDLERLLSKTRSQIMTDEQKIQFVNRNGSTF